jgi:two-component system, cell cycle sensor histidine kinase and response regulator CckA
MAKRTLRVLNVEDSERDVALLVRHLSRAGYDLISERVETRKAMQTALEKQEWDVILCDYSMPHFNALAALKLLQELKLVLPFIIISGTIGEEIAVEAMRAGAHDYLMKDNLVRLAPAIERELEEAKNRRARREAEEALRESEQRLRGVTDTARVGLVVVDEAHRYRYANRTYAEILGLSASNIVGRLVSEVLAPVYAEQIRPRLERAFRGGRVNYELMLPPSAAGGDERYYDVTYEPRPSREGATVVVVVVDITERKRAEQQIRLQATALQAAANAIVITDHLGTITWINPAFTALTGYTVEEATGQNPRILKSGEHDAAFYQALWDTILSGQVWHGEMINRRKDGQLYFEEQTITPVMNETGALINFIAIKQDATERKQAEVALRESEERYRGLINSAFDGVVVHQNGIVLGVNRAYAEMLGYEIEELIGRNILALTPPEQRDFVASEIEHDQSLYEALGLKKDGTRINIEVSATKCIYEGKQARLAAVRDVTERKQLEEQLRQSQKLEAIGQLAGGIAHDFNNLLTAINGYSELTLRRLQADDPLQQNIKEIMKAGERAAALTRHLLAFSRKQVLQPKVLDLNAVVSELEKMLQRLIGEDIEMRTVLGTEIGSVRADPGQIEQIIMNLVVNARDAMPHGGKLTIETENVSLDESYAKNHIAVTPGPYVMLAVSDTGMGMADETRARIFEPFFTTKEVGKGTGLGLSTVYGIVKQSGGNIWVYSEVGRGTTFKIYLPRVDEGAEEYKRSAEAEGAVRGAETVLLTEDEEIVRKLARQVLELYGYRVLEAANGGTALLICERHAGPIHLLITDVVMPEMSGRELADRLAGLRPEMKVLYMSGYTDNAIVHHGVLDESANFIQKPFSTDALARKVREVLDAPKKSL